MSYDARDGRGCGKINGCFAAFRYSAGEEMGEPDGSESFESVQKKNRVPVSFAKNAQDVRCANIAASNGPNIDTRDASGKIAAWKRANQIADCERDYRSEPHGLSQSRRL